jgi:hypothetical protein
MVAEIEISFILTSKYKQCIWDLLKGTVGLTLAEVENYFLHCLFQSERTGSQSARTDEQVSRCPFVNKCPPDDLFKDNPITRRNREGLETLLIC